MECNAVGNVRCCGVSSSVIVGTSSQLPAMRKKFNGSKFQSHTLPSNVDPFSTHLLANRNQFIRSKLQHSTLPNNTLNSLSSLTNTTLPKKLLGTTTENIIAYKFKKISDVDLLNEKSTKELVKETTVLPDELTTLLNSEPKVNVEQSEENTFAPATTIQSVNDADLTTIVLDTVDSTTSTTTTDISLDNDATTTLLPPLNDKQRRPKLVDNVLMIYPSEMSGIPKTTPKNMPANNQMNMYDEQMGVKVHLIFATNDTEPITAASSRIEEPSLEQISSNVTADTTSPPKTKLIEIKKRRRYRPNRGRNSTAATSTSHVPAQKLGKFARHRTPVFQVKQRYDGNSRGGKVANTTMRSLLVKTDSDSSHEKTYESRHRLLSANNRLNFLRKNKPIRTAKPKSNDNNEDHTSKSILAGDDSDLPNIKIIELSPNRTFMSHVDTQHKYMIEHVRSVLKTAATFKPDMTTTAPRAFAGSEMKNRITRIENMLVDKLNNNFRKMNHNNNEEQLIERPYRGNRRYQSTDINASNLNSIITTTTIRPSRRPEVTPDIDHTTRASLFRIRPVRPSFVKKFTEQESTNAPDIKKSKSRAQQEESLKQKKILFRKRIGPQYRRNLFGRITTESTIKPMNISIETVSTTTSTTTTNTTTTNITTTNTTTTITPTPETTTISLELNETTEQDTTTDQVSISTTTTQAGVPLVLAAGSLIAEFKPSPLWTLHDEERIDETPVFVTSQRQSRDAFHQPRLINGGFIPIYRNDESLLIVGPIPKSNPIRDDGRIRFGLPTVQAQKFA